MSLVHMAKKLSGGLELLYSGTGTSIDCTDIVGYKNLTADNFIVEAQTGSGNGESSQQIQTGGRNDFWDTFYSNCSFTLNKSYDSSTGIFTFSATASGGGAYHGPSGSCSKSLTCNVYYNAL